MELEQTVARGLPISAPQAVETERTWDRVGRWLVVVGIVVGVLLPFVPLMVWSFSHRWYFPDLVPTQWSLRAWRYVFSPGS